MKRIAVIMAVVAFGVSSVFAQGEMSREQLQVLFQEMLDEKGYENYIDEDGDVVYEDGELSYYIDVTEDDPSYFRIALPNIWPIESHEEYLQVLQATNHVTAESKVVKVYEVRDDVWISVETYIASYNDVPHHFELSMEAIETAISMFTEEMNQ